MKRQQIYRYTFSNGDTYTSALSKEEFMARLRRLDKLRVLTEQHESPQGKNICKKAIQAYDKRDNFTGIIRLNFSEKDWLSYMLESDMLSDEDKEVIKYYI